MTAARTRAVKACQSVGVTRSTGPAVARSRFGDWWLDYVSVRWGGHGAVIRAEVTDGRSSELDLVALTGMPDESQADA